MRKFTSQDANHRISHPSLKHAAGSRQFVLTFREGMFETANEALADALVALAPRGVEEVTPKPEPKPKKGKKDEE